MKKLIIALVFVSVLSVTAISQEVQAEKISAAVPGSSEFLGASLVFEDLWNKRLDSSSAFEDYLRWKASYGYYFNSTYLLNIFLNKNDYSSEVIQNAWEILKILSEPESDPATDPELTDIKIFC